VRQPALRRPRRDLHRIEIRAMAIGVPPALSPPARSSQGEGAVYRGRLAPGGRGPQNDSWLCPIHGRRAGSWCRTRHLDPSRVICAHARLIATRRVANQGFAPRLQLVTDAKHILDRVACTGPPRTGGSGRSPGLTNPAGQMLRFGVRSRLAVRRPANPVALCDGHGALLVADKRDPRWR